MASASASIKRVPPADGLGLDPVHQLGAEDSIGEAGEVLDMGGGHQLTARDSAVLKTRDHHRAEVGPCCVDRCGVAGGAGAHDDEVFNRSGRASGHGLKRNDFALV